MNHRLGDGCLKVNAKVNAKANVNNSNKNNSKPQDAATSPLEGAGLVALSQAGGGKGHVPAVVLDKLRGVRHPALLLLHRGTSAHPHEHFGADIEDVHLVRLENKKTQDINCRR